LRDDIHDDLVFGKLKPTSTIRPSIISFESSTAKAILCKCG
jgi:hypothetical protein